MSIQIRNLYKSFHDNQVLRNVDLDVKEREIVVLMGLSGSGKTTLLRCLCDLETADSGEILINDSYLLKEENGRSVYADKETKKALRKEVGMVFQNFNLFPHMTALENVMLAPRRVLKKSQAECRELAQRMLEKVGLGDRLDYYPANLSGGQQQRVAIARALAMSPKVLLCDEITSALDPELVGEVLKVLEQLAAEGMTLILVTHEMNFAREVGDRVVFMHQGRVWEQGDSKTLFASPQTTELKQFISSVRGLN